MRPHFTFMVRLNCPLCSFWLPKILLYIGLLRQLQILFCSPLAKSCFQNQKLTRKDFASNVARIAMTFLYCCLSACFPCHTMETWLVGSRRCGFVQFIITVKEKKKTTQAFLCDCTFGFQPIYHNLTKISNPNEIAEADVYSTSFLDETPFLDFYQFCWLLVTYCEV